jgi:hypothetical protein
MGYFASSAGALNTKSLPVMLWFHVACITTESFNSETGQCNLLLAIEPIYSQVTSVLGLRGVQGYVLEDPSYRPGDLGLV